MAIIPVDLSNLAPQPAAPAIVPVTLANSAAVPPAPAVPVVQNLGEVQPVNPKAVLPGIQTIPRLTKTVSLLPTPRQTPTGAYISFNSSSTGPSGIGLSRLSLKPLTPDEAVRAAINSATSQLHMQTLNNPAAQPHKAPPQGHGL